MKDAPRFLALPTADGMSVPATPSTRPTLRRAGIAIALTLGGLATQALAADAPTGSSATTAPAAVAGSVEKVVVKSTAHFGFDQAAISAADRAAMLAEVGKMKDVTWQTVTATGFTDSVGDDGYNERLSQRRAAAVKAYLVGNGIDATMVRAQGKAEAQPIGDNGTEPGRAANRRTEIEFQGVRPATR